jgi:hypothetical protein
MTTGGAVRTGRRCAVALLAALVALAGLTACGEDTGSPAGAEEPGGYDQAAPAPEPDYDLASCDYYSWREAQDELDADPALEEALDDDYDGIACNDLAQDEYATGWATSYPEACEAVFFESPDGVLYLDGVGYEQFECEDTDPGPGEWEGDPYSEPEDDGLREGWQTACEEFFAYVGGDLFWGDDISVTQADCELASSY